MVVFFQRIKIWLLFFSLTSFSLLKGQVKSIQSFNLRNVTGEFWQLDSQTNALGFMVVFTCNHCPFANLYPSRLNAISNQYSNKGVPLIAINSMDSMLYEEEGYIQMQVKAKSEGFQFPYLQDATQEVGAQFGADHTPHAYVIWREGEKWVVKYSGAIDDNGEDSKKAVSYLTAAVDDLLAHRTVKKPRTESFGCRIIYRN